MRHLLSVLVLFGAVCCSSCDPIWTESWNFIILHNRTYQKVWGKLAEHYVHYTHNGVTRDDTLVVDPQTFYYSSEILYPKSNIVHIELGGYPNDWKHYFAGWDVDTIYVMVADSKDKLLQWSDSFEDSLLLRKYVLTKDSFDMNSARKDIYYDGPDKSSDDEL
jgi:hypothetical protein